MILAWGIGLVSGDRRSLQGRSSLPHECAGFEGGGVSGQTSADGIGRLSVMGRLGGFETAGRTAEPRLDFHLSVDPARRPVDGWAMTDFEFLWCCTARLEQTTDLLIQALNIDECPDRSGGEVVQALGKAAWFARVTRGFIGSRLADILRRARFPDPEAWLREITSELEQIERAPEIRPLLADLMKRHQSLVTATTSALVSDKTANEKFPDFEFVWSLLLTLKGLRKSLDEFERIDRAPSATGHESIRATFEFQFWAERAKHFPSDRLVEVASTYGLPNAQFWRFDFSDFLNSLSKGKYEANMSIEKIIDIQNRWEPVRDVLSNEVFVQNQPDSVQRNQDQTGGRRTSTRNRHEIPVGQLALLGQGLGKLEQSEIDAAKTWLLKQLNKNHRKLTLGLSGNGEVFEKPSFLLEGIADQAEQVGHSRPAVIWAVSELANEGLWTAAQKFETETTSTDSIEEDQVTYWRVEIRIYWSTREYDLLTARERDRVEMLSGCVDNPRSSEGEWIRDFISALARLYATVRERTRLRRDPTPDQSKLAANTRLANKCLTEVSKWVGDCLINTVKVRGELPPLVDSPEFMGIPFIHLLTARLRVLSLNRNDDHWAFERELRQTIEWWQETLLLISNNRRWSNGDESGQVMKSSPSDERSQAIADLGKSTARHRRKKGRNREYDPEKDAVIARRWCEAREVGATKDQFAAQNGLEKDELERLLDRSRKPRKK